MRDYTDRLALSQRRSHALWFPYLPLPLLTASEPSTAFASPVQESFAALFTDADYVAEVQRTRAWLVARFDWLDSRIMGL